MSCSPGSRQRGYYKNTKCNKCGWCTWPNRCSSQRSRVLGEFTSDLHVCRFCSADESGIKSCDESNSALRVAWWIIWQQQWCVDDEGIFADTSLIIGVSPLQWEVLHRLGTGEQLQRYCFQFHCCDGHCLGEHTQLVTREKFIWGWSQGIACIAWSYIQTLSLDWPLQTDHSDWKVKEGTGGWPSSHMLFLLPYKMSIIFTRWIRHQ